MEPILICLLIGAGFAFERFIFLARASRGSEALFRQALESLKAGDAASALRCCIGKRSSLAHILHAGLLRIDLGIDAVEHSVERAGAIELGFLEKNLAWLASVSSIAPMLGFLGAVFGLVNTLDGIARANDLYPALVAGGIADSLFPMMFGLSVAIPIEILHRYFVLRIDRMVLEMEERAQEFVDAVAELYG